MELVSHIICAVFLTGCLIQDIRTGKINKCRLLLHFIAAVVLAIAKKHALELLFGVMPGAVILGIARLSKERIGTGDALICVVLGMYLGPWSCFSVIMLGCLFSSMWGGFMTLIRRMDPKAYIIFTPFLLMGYCLCSLMDMWGS